MFFVMILQRPSLRRGDREFLNLRNSPLARSFCVGMAKHFCLNAIRRHSPFHPVLRATPKHPLPRPVPRPPMRPLPFPPRSSTRVRLFSLLCCVALLTMIVPPDALRAQGDPIATPSTAPVPPPSVAPTPALIERTVYTPYEQLEQVFEKEDRGVFLPYREFLDLWNKLNLPADLKKNQPPVDGVLASAHYTGPHRRRRRHLRRPAPVRSPQGRLVQGPPRRRGPQHRRGQTRARPGRPPPPPPSSTSPPMATRPSCPRRAATPSR